MDSVIGIKLNQSDFLSRIINIKGAGEGQTIAVLQRSLSKELEPFMRLRKLMFSLFALGFLLAVIGVFYIARNLSRPLETLTEAVKRIDLGELEFDNK